MMYGPIAVHLQPAARQDFVDIFKDGPVAIQVPTIDKRSDIPFRFPAQRQERFRFGCHQEAFLP